jgi:hypothetical protein
VRRSRWGTLGGSPRSRWGTLKGSPKPPRHLGAFLLSLGALAIAACTAPEPSASRTSSPSTASPAPRPAPGPDPRGTIKELDALRLPIGTGLTIDGKLDEPAWRAAKGTGPFVDVGSGRENPGLPTQGNARLLWDDQFLYVGFEVTDKKVHGGWPLDAGTGKEPHLWDKDTVEIMFDPDGDGDNKDYYEIQINPQNLVFDTQYDDYNSPNGNGKGPYGHEEWSSKLTSAVVVHGTLDDDSDVDQGYTVEAKIPWASFTKAQHAPPLPGSTSRMNFYAMKNNGGTAWSPILGMGNFHRASRFGRVRWSATVAQ